MQNLGLKPGESVTLRNSDKFEEVHVFGGPDGESRLGTLTQKFIYKKVGNHSVRAKIHSIHGDRLRLELEKA
ncbi:hypothetical protein CHU92_00615 [Flavobacterium cyanobacteriorum]|uniref:Uncharacterized protein n=1 Tax=Flavobacterium cyanobacteriorum TaxID=2022802 RepID=A0A256A4F3_9FLAO|nr:hypothetical protein [Flavobacterium cyanobacteriorum]OYQ48638.1 hypothetical protein CHU92_00615 [Flavobacterium cyanobacteriorum]